MTQLAELNTQIDLLPPLSEVALRILELVTDPEFKIDALVAIVRTDPTLTGRLLKLCNSSMYALPREVTSVGDAVGFLGTRSLVRLVVAACAQHYYSDADLGYHDRPGTIWRHSVCCGIAAQAIAEISNAVDVGAAFTAGILHNIGKVVLASMLECEIDTMQGLIEEHDGDHLLVERALAGIDHAAAGGLIADKWLLPTDLRRAVKHHHDPEKILVDNPLTAVVHLADLVAIQVGGATATDAFAHPIASEALSRLNIGDEVMDLVRLQVVDETRRSKELLKL